MRLKYFFNFMNLYFNKNISDLVEDQKEKRNQRRVELEKQIDELWGKKKEISTKLKFLAKVQLATQKMLDKVKKNFEENDNEKKTITQFAEKVVVTRSKTRTRTAIVPVEEEKPFDPEDILNNLDIEEKKLESSPKKQDARISKRASILTDKKRRKLFFYLKKVIKKRYK